MNDSRTETLRRVVPVPVRSLCQRLCDRGHRAWVVGGCVRDVLLADLSTHGGAAAIERAEHTVSNDWDIATDARPEQIKTVFRRVIPTGIEHGTVTVLLDDQAYEVTTLRGETTYSDSRRPDAVFFVDDIVDDLARRDFTINAIAYDPLEDRLIDPFDGIVDLKSRRLRAVGVPKERFAEDGLRVLRAARFVATLEVEMDAATAQAIEPSLNSYRKVSAERIRDEWLKTMKARRPSRAFEVMRDHGLLAITAPELLESVGCVQNRYHAYDVWKHAMECMNSCPAEPVLRIAGLLHDVGKPRSRGFSEEKRDYTFYEHDRIGAEMTGRLLERLRFSNEDAARIVALVRHHLICYEPSWSDAAVRRWIRRVSPELLEHLYALNRADVLAKGVDVTADLVQVEGLKVRVSEVLAAGAVLSVRDLAIGGRDLMRELSMEPGPRIGQVLRGLLEEVIEDPQRNQRETLLLRAREMIVK